MKKEALRVSTTIPAAPTTVYLAWLSAEQHSEMTGGVAKIDTEVGGKFTTLNGLISGKLVILDLGRRLLMSWRTTDFPREAPDSRVEVHFEALGGSTRITVLHTEIPEGLGESLRTTWNEKYFAPMRSFFSKYLPDPRKPPPPRRPIPPPDEDDEDVEEAAPPKKGKIAKAPLSSKKLVAMVASKVKEAPEKAPAKPTKEAPPAKPVKAPAKSVPPAKPTKAAPAKPAKAPAKPAKAPAKPAKAPKPAASSKSAKKPAKPKKR